MEGQNLVPYARNIEYVKLSGRRKGKEIFCYYHLLWFCGSRGHNIMMSTASKTASGSAHPKTRWKHACGGSKVASPWFMNSGWKKSDKGRAVK